MIIEYTSKRHTVVHFSPTEVAGAGLPAQPMFVEYDARMFLFDYSSWAGKSLYNGPSVDRIIAQADQAVGWV